MKVWQLRIEDEEGHKTWPHNFWLFEERPSDLDLFLFFTHPDNESLDGYFGF